MKIINYLSTIILPLIILIIISFGISEKVSVYDIFLKGAKNGMKTVIKLYPTLLGIFIAIGLLRTSGIIEFITKIIYPIISFLHIPEEIIPLAMLRPISGSASTAVATDIMNNYGVDSKIGLIASVIMGSTETTFYTIAVYTSSVKIKDTKNVLFPSLIADFVGIVVSIIICSYV